MVVARSGNGHIVLGEERTLCAGRSVRVAFLELPRCLAAVEAAGCTDHDAGARHVPGAIQRRFQRDLRISKDVRRCQQICTHLAPGIFSQLPFGSNDEHGNPVLRLLPVPKEIPPGTPPNPQAAQVFAVNVKPIKIRRVVATNSFTHDLPGN